MKTDFIQTAIMISVFKHVPYHLVPNVNLKDEATKAQQAPLECQIAESSNNTGAQTIVSGS